VNLRPIKQQPNPVPYFGNLMKNVGMKVNAALLQFLE
jgi:hypothetical protein